MNCAYCREVIVADIPGLHPVFLEIFEGEGFIIHGKCGNEIHVALGKKKTPKARKKFLLELAKKMSDGQGAEDPPKEGGKK